MSKNLRLTVNGWGIWIEWAEIGADIGARLIEEGLTTEELEELLLGGESQLGITSNIDVCIDDASVGMDVPDVGECDREAVVQDNQKWFLVAEQALKGAFVEDQVRKPFDREKLEFTEYPFDAAGRNFCCYEVTYDGESLSIGDTEPKVYDVYVVSPSSEWNAIDISNSDDDEEFDDVSTE